MALDYHALGSGVVALGVGEQTLDNLRSGKREIKVQQEGEEEAVGRTADRCGHVCAGRDLLNPGKFQEGFRGDGAEDCREEMLRRVTTQAQSRERDGEGDACE